MFAHPRTQAGTDIRDLPADRKSGMNISKKAARTAWSGAVLALFVLLAAGALILPVNGYTTTDSLIAAGKVYVSNVTIDPGTLFTGDTATVTFAVTNGDNTVANSTTGQGIMVNHATFGDNDIRLVSGSYDSSSNIGPLQTRTYVFDVITTEMDGTYYPTFSLDFRDAGSLYYRTPVKIDNTPLLVSVVDQPDTFTQGTKDTVTVQIANPRDNSVKNVVLTVTGNDTTITPSQQYLGVIGANSATNVTLSVTPDSETVLDVDLKYDNGDNHHAVSTTLPITFGTDKKRATPKVSNIEIKMTGGAYEITGDVTNAGLTTANGVSVTTLSPAVPEDPYKTYVIGALKPDDFGSFEVTFSVPNNTASIPLQVSYKDADGNIITTLQDVSIMGVVPDNANKQDSPVLPIVIVIVIIAAGGYYYYTKKIKKQ